MFTFLTFRETFTEHKHRQNGLKAKNSLMLLMKKQSQSLNLQFCCHPK